MLFLRGNITWVKSALFDNLAGVKNRGCGGDDAWEIPENFC